MHPCQIAATFPSTSVDFRSNPSSRLPARPTSSWSSSTTWASAPPARTAARARCPTARAAGRRRAAVQPLPRDRAVLAHPAGADDRPQPPLGRHGRHHRDGDPATPATTATGPASAATLAQILRGNGYSTAAFGKWHQTPPGEVSPVGPVHPLADRRGLRPLLRLHGRRDEPLVPPALRGHARRSSPTGCPRRATTSPRTWSTTRSTGSRTQQALTPERPFFPYLALGATHAPFHVAPEWIERYARPVRRRLGRPARADPGPPEGARRRARRRPSSRPGPRESRTGTSSTTPAQRVAARLMETYAGFAEHADAPGRPARRRARGARASSTTR